MACGGSASTDADPQVAEQSSDALTASDKTVDFEDNMFTPDFVWAKPGSTIRLTNNSGSTELFSVVNQSTGGTVTSRSLDSGRSVRLRFSKAGSFQVTAPDGSVDVEISSTRPDTGESGESGESGGSSDCGGSTNGMGFTRTQGCGCGGSTNGMGFTRTESCGGESTNGMGFR